jgi:anti-sigma B factor antagonist
VQIAQQRQGAVTVIKPQGPLVGTDAEQFMGETLGALESSFGRLVVDASGVPFCDSRGLEVLVEISRAMNKSGQSLRMTGAVDVVRESMELTDIAHMFEYYQDVQTAVRSFL